MAFRFTISRKIGLGFGLFILVVAFVFYLTNNTLSESREINKRINEIYAPSVKALEELDNQLVRVQQLMKIWAFVQKREDDREHLEAIELCNSTVPAQLDKIKAFSQYWSESDVAKQNFMRLQIEIMLDYYEEIRGILPVFDSYADPFNSMMAEEYYLDGGPLNKNFDEVRDKLKYLTNVQRSSMTNEMERMNKSFATLRTFLVNIALGVLFAGILIAVLTSRSIVSPVISLRKKLTDLSKGIYSVHLIKAGNDEIGDMAEAVKKLIRNFEMTKEFSTNVGAGNFDFPFAPLSEHDELGKSLIRMKDDLASYRHEMEQKVHGQTIEIRKQKDEVEAQRERVMNLYTDLQSSIDYAQRLQETILPDSQFVKKMFDDSFVLFLPKATVSGDFYWFKEKGTKKIFAAVDCTGHGVPGAFMSLIGHNLLNQSTKVYSNPAQILNSTNRLSGEVMRAKDGEHYMKDGMDIAICTLDTVTNILEFSGAHNPVYIIRDGEIIELKADSFSIGSYVNGEREFTHHQIQLQSRDCIYLFSDGFVDQFGGEKGKKFMRRRFKAMLLEHSDLPMNQQMIAFKNTLRQWQGNQGQIDDILLMGIRV